jgi:hypothetical protein
VVQDFTKPVVYTVTAQNGSTLDYIVTVIEAGRDPTKKLTAFSIPSQEGDSIPDEANKIVEVTMPYGTDVRALIPTIVVSPKATVSPASEVAQDFSKPVVYTVTAENGSTQDYTVVVTVNPGSDAKTFTGFTILDQEGTTALTGNTFTVTMPVGTNMRALVPTFTIPATATVSPASQVVQDFRRPVVYTVTAQDGSTADYTVVVIEATRSGENTIAAFTINKVEGTINEDLRTITFTTGKDANAELPVGINVNSLIPVITLTGTGTPSVVTSTVSPPSLAAKNFTEPVVYTVTAQNGTTRDYTVVVQRSSEKKISELTIDGVGPDVEDEDSAIIAVTMPAGTSARLAPAFKISDGATVSPASGTPRDFSQGSQAYTVTAEDGSTKEFVVVVVVEDPLTAMIIDLAGTDKDIEIYSTPGFGTGHNISLSLNGRANNKEAVVSLKVTGSATWTVSGWKVDGRTASEIYGNSSNIITLKASNYFIGRHSVTFTVIVNGKPYSEQFYFTVDK